jgi:GAF domain-containing protein/HAMP domain-containing protein
MMKLNRFSRDGMTVQTQRAFIVSLIYLAGNIAATAVFAFLTVQTPAWQLNIVTLTAALLTITSAIAAWLSWRNQPVMAVRAIVGAMFVAMIVVPFFFADIGLVVGLAGLVAAIVTAVQVLGEKDITALLILSIMAAVAANLGDILQPATQLPVTDIDILTPIVVGLAVVLAISAIFIIRNFQSFSMSTKLILAFLGVALIPLTVLAVLSEQNASQNLTSAANQRLSASALAVKFKLEDFIDSNLDTVRNQALLPDFIDLLTPGSEISNTRARNILFNLNSRDLKFITSYGLLNRDGINVVDTAGGKTGGDESEQDYFRSPLITGEPYVGPVTFTGRVDELRPTNPALGTTPSEALFARFDYEPEMIFSAPVRNLEGQILGVLRVRYRAQVLQQLIDETTGIAGEGSYAALFDENNLLLADGKNPQTADETNYKLVDLPLDTSRLTALWSAKRIPDVLLVDLSTDLPDLAANLDNSAQEPFFEAIDVGDERVNQVAAQMLDKYETLPWRIAFFQPQSSFLQVVDDQRQTNLRVAIFISGLVAAAAVGVAHLLARPTVRLTEVVRRIAAGAREERALVESNDETGQLAAAFNEMNDQLNAFIYSLEDQVRERTADLTLSMEVGQRAASIRTLDELLPTITEYIRQQFDLYYTQVYFVDDLGQRVVLRAGTGEVGQQLLARRHSLPVGVGSIVGRVAAEAHPIVVSDTENSDIHLPNPLLPATRSEMAIPLIVEGRVIGVLDMQADQVDTFTEQNLTVFEAMATQLAIAIDGAQQWTVAQAAQQRAEEAVRRLTRETWTEQLSASERQMNFVYDLSSIKQERLARENGLSMPLIIQNQPIGRLQVEPAEGEDLNQDDHAFLVAVAQQLVQKAENLRLFEQTQRRAEREQLTRQITERVRASNDIASALKTAAEELSKALHIPRAVVDLKVPETKEAANGAANDGTDR